MHTIYHDFTINVPKERVFKAISLPNELNNWWTKRCSGTPELDAVYNFYFAEEYNWFAEISILKHDEQVEFKMTKATTEWLPTSFGFILKEINPTTTSVEFYHKNWTEVSKEYKVASYCWANLLRQMKKYLEKGTITPFQQRN